MYSLIGRSKLDQQRNVVDGHRRQVDDLAAADQHPPALVVADAVGEASPGRERYVISKLKPLPSSPHCSGVGVMRGSAMSRGTASDRQSRAPTAS